MNAAAEKQKGNIDELLQIAAIAEIIVDHCQIERKIQSVHIIYKIELLKTYLRQ